MPVLNFFGNHTLDFKNSDFDELQNYVISQLGNIDIPKDILLMELDSLRLHFSGADLSKFVDIENWCPFSFPDPIGEHNLPHRNIALIGKMGMNLVFTPKHIRLPGGNYQPLEWYSPHNKEKVQAWRDFYYKIISQFGGDHALYVDDQKTSTYYDPMEDASLHKFEQALEERYGPPESMISLSHGEYLEYYIDTFADLKAP